MQRLHRRRHGRLALLMQLLQLVLRRAAGLPEPRMVDAAGSRGGRRCRGRVMMIVDDGGGQMSEPVLGGQHVGVMVVVVRRRLLRWRRWRRAATGADRVLVSMHGVMVVRVSRRRRRHVRVHQRLVPPALAPVACYRHVKFVERAELVHSRLVRVQVFDVSKR